MKNKIVDLRNHLFEQLERLGDESKTDKELASEIDRAKAMKEIAQVIVNSAKVEVDFIRFTQNTDSNEFLGYPDTRTLAIENGKKS